MINVGIIGLGKMGLLHACILNMLPGVRVSAICEKHPAVKLFAPKILAGLKIVGKLEDLKQFALEAIYVTTSSASHYAVIKDIYALGLCKNIFVEKPLCMQEQQSSKLCALAAQHGGANMVGYNKRHCPTFKKAREIIEAGQLGRIQHISATAYSADFHGLSRFIPQAYARGGALHDIGCHVIDLLQWLLGNFQVTKSELITQTNKEKSYIDDARGQIRFDNGTHGDFHISWCQANYRLPQMDLNIRGSQGQMNVNEYELEILNDGNANKYYKHELEEGVPYFQGEADYYREDAGFIRAIKDGQGIQNGFLAACNVDRILDEIILKGRA